MIVWQRRSGIRITLDGAAMLRLRESRGWSRREMADSVGVSRVTISNWENEECCPSLPQIGKLRGVFGDELAQSGAVEVA